MLIIEIYEKNKCRYYKVDKSCTRINVFLLPIPGDFSCLNVPLYTRNFTLLKYRTVGGKTKWRQ